EVVNFMRLACFAGPQKSRDFTALARVLAGPQLVDGPHGPSRADQAVPTAQPQAEPGGGPWLIGVRATLFALFDKEAVDAAQPQRQGTQFNGHRVEVDAVHIACGDVVL